MDLTQIQNFLVLVKEGTLSKAAKKLYISQPALTKQMKLLEKEMNCSLFERTRNGIQLTKEGELFLEYGEFILERTEKLHTDIEKQIRVDYRDFIIGHSTDYHRDIINNAVAELYSYDRHLSISMVQDMPQHLLEGVISGKISCAFMHLVSAKDIKGVTYTIIKKGGISARMSAKDKLSENETISILDLKGYTWIQNEKSDSKFIEYVSDFFKKYKISPKIKKVSGKANTDLNATIDKQFAMVSDYNHVSNNVKLLKIKEIREGMDIVLVYRNEDNNPFIHKFVEILSKNYN